MKIHNFGSDYAYQQRLKIEAEDKHIPQSIVKPELNPTDNVEHQFQTGGETTVATTNNKAIHSESDLSKETEKAPRKKKKERSNDIQ